jgi:hypothetical protein
MTRGRRPLFGYIRNAWLLGTEDRDSHQFLSFNGLLLNGRFGMDIECSSSHPQELTRTSIMGFVNQGSSLAIGVPSGFLADLKVMWEREYCARLSEVSYQPGFLWT